MADPVRPVRASKTRQGKKSRIFPFAPIVSPRTRKCGGRICITCYYWPSLETSCREGRESQSLALFVVWLYKPLAVFRQMNGGNKLPLLHKLICCRASTCNTCASRLLPRALLTRPPLLELGPAPSGAAPKIISPPGRVPICLAGALLV